MEWKTVLFLGGGGGALLGLGYEIAKRNLKFRKVGLGVMLVGFAMLAGLFVANFWPASKATEPAATASASKSLGFTVAEFKDRLNQSAGRMGVKLRVDDPVVSPVKPDDTCETFRVVLGENLGMVGSADKITHSLSSFILFMSPNGNARSDERSVAQLLVSSMVLIDMCNPGLAKEQLEGVLRELGLLGGQTKAEKRDLDQGKDFLRSAQLAQVRYTFRVSPGGRAYFTVQPL